MTVRMAQNWGLFITLICLALHYFLIDYSSALVNAVLGYAIDHDLQWLQIGLGHLFWGPRAWDHIILFIIELVGLFVIFAVLVRFFGLLKSVFSRRPETQKGNQ